MDESTPGDLGDAVAWKEAEPQKKVRRISILPILTVVMVVIPFLFAAGCTGNPPEPTELHLEGTKWALREYVYNGTSMHVLPVTTLSLFFRQGGKVFGSAGCNIFSGHYELAGTTIAIRQIGLSEIACLDPGVMDQEVRYLSLLVDAASVTVENDTLALTDSQGNLILTFERMVLTGPEIPPLS